MIIGIIGAMEEEVSIVKNEMNVERIEKKAGMEFFKGKFLGKEVVVVKSGIGKVNAAVCTQILIDDFNVDMVINTGVAGAVHDDINPGDVVVSTDLVHHDVDATVFGYELGQIPRMKDMAFKADEKLAELAFASAEKLNEYKVFKGRIITGDQAIASAEKKKFFKEKFNAFAVEMEGAAIGQTCYINNIPFVVIRSISDRADGNADMDYNTFIDIAIKNSIVILTNMLNSL
jgi:adenosylhomocysteine nucleosidase